MRIRPALLLALSIAGLLLSVACTPSQPTPTVGSAPTETLETIDPAPCQPGRDEPPGELNAEEAVDLARFRGYFAHGLVRIPRVREALVADLTWGDAKAFLREVQAPGDQFDPLPQDASKPVFFVVLRGQVEILRADATSTPHQALAIALGRNGGAHYIGIGAPWDAIAPPGAQAVPTRDEPNFVDVSVAYALSWVGHLREPANLPADLALQQINVNRGTPVDPTGATLARDSVTLSYGDCTGQPRVWLSQSSFLGEPQVISPWTPVRIGDGWGNRYMWETEAGKLVSLAWQRGDRWFYLTADLSRFLTERDLVKTAGSIVVTTPAPVVPGIAPPPGVRTGSIAGNATVIDSLDHSGTIVRVAWADEALGRDGAADGRTAPAGLRHPPLRTGRATFTASGSPSDGLDGCVGNIGFSAILVGFIHPASGVVRFVPLPSDCPPSPCGRLSRPRTTTRALPHVRRWPKAGLLRSRRAGRASQVRPGCIFMPS